MNKIYLPIEDYKSSIQDRIARNEDPVSFSGRKIKAIITPIKIAGDIPPDIEADSSMVDYV